MNTYRRLFAALIASQSNNPVCALCTVKNGVIRVHELDHRNGFGENDGTWTTVTNCNHFCVHFASDTPTIAARDLGLKLMAFPKRWLDGLETGTFAIRVQVYGSTVGVSLVQWEPAGLEIQDSPRWNNGDGFIPPALTPVKMPRSSFLRDWLSR